MRNTEPRKGTETNEYRRKNAASIIEKHRTPEGDGNPRYTPMHVDNRIEKHRTPEGDGNEIFRDSMQNYKKY